MTEELQAALDRDLESALDSGDPNQIDRALVNSNKAVISCQRKMAERVKLIASDHPVLVNDVKEIKELVTNARRSLRDMTFSAFKWIVVGGGGVEFVRYILSHWQ